MLMSRWFRLCTLCSRVYSSRGRRRAGWRTLTGHTGLKHANVTEVQHWGTIAPKRLCHSDMGDLYKNESVQRYLQQLMEDYRDLSKKLQHAYLNESDRKVLIKRHTELLPLANVFESVEQALKDLEEVLSLLHSEYFGLFLYSLIKVLEGFHHISSFKLTDFSLTAGSAGTKDEDEQLTQLLKEEEVHISRKIVAIRKDVRTQKDDICVKMCYGICIIMSASSFSAVDQSSCAV